MAARAEGRLEGACCMQADTKEAASAPWALDQTGCEKEGELARA